MSEEGALIDVTPARPAGPAKPVAGPQPPATIELKPDRAEPAAMPARSPRRGARLAAGALNTMVVAALAVVALQPVDSAPGPSARTESPALVTGSLPATQPPAMSADTAAPAPATSPAEALQALAAGRIATLIPIDVGPRATRVASAEPKPQPTPVVAPADDAPSAEAATRDRDTAASADPAPVKATPPAGTPPPPPIPRPVLPASEAAFVTRMDAILAPVRNRGLSLSDAEKVRDAFANAANVATVRALRDDIRDPVARKLVDWSLLRNGAGTARDVQAFLAANPDWPSRDLLHQRAEEHVFMSGGAARDIKAFFAAQEPRTAIGRAALASALLAEGDEAGAARLAARAWRDGNIPTLLEMGFLERFARLLTPEDHKWRLDRLLLDDERWEGERKDRAALIRRLLPMLSEPERAKANARLAVFMRAPDASKLMAALPADAAIKPVADWGFTHQLIQWHRRAGRTAEARAILLGAPTDPDLIVSPDDWWEERRVSAYAALREGQAQAAYDLVKDAGPLGVNARKDQAFLAGWIAKRHLNDPKRAEPHFIALADAADGPLSRAKAAFWLARTHAALGRLEQVRPQLERAARHVDTFYGHLAMQELEPGRTHLPVTPPQLPSEAEAATFNSRDAVQAVVVARRAGLDASVMRAFLVHLRNTLPSEPEHAMIAHLAEAVGDTQMAVRVAKGSVARGLNLLFYAYPIHAMPAYQPLRPPPEAALLLAIARQESEFNTLIRSGAGARGLLQVMPITANHVCRDYNLKCDIDRLSTDPAYNAKMASAYIADRMEEFGGSYVLAIAGYNAGPGRARQWIREFGDPRDPAVDPIDWIHRIPFEETRDYVQKVLSNLQVYRARLGAPELALQVGADLRRTAPRSR